MAKTSTEKSRYRRKRLKKLGTVLGRYDCHPADKQKINKFIRALNVARWPNDFYVHAGERAKDEIKLDHA